MTACQCDAQNITVAVLATRPLAKAAPKLSATDELPAGAPPRFQSGKSPTAAAARRVPVAFTARIVRDEDSRLRECKVRVT
jgi:hypothetical protein